MFSLSNAVSIPTTNPTGGGLIYEESGWLKVLSSSGVVFNTTQQAALADTSGATLAQLEIDVNAMKAKYRASGLMASV